MHHDRRTLRSHVPRPHPVRGPRAPSPTRAPRGDAGALLSFRARRAALLGVLHRPHPEPEHASRLGCGAWPARTSSSWSNSVAHCSARACCPSSHRLQALHACCAAPLQGEAPLRVLPALPGEPLEHAVGAAGEHYPGHRTVPVKVLEGRVVDGALHRLRGGYSSPEFGVEGNSVARRDDPSLRSDVPATGRRIEDGHAGNATVKP